MSTNPLIGQKVRTATGAPGEIVASSIVPDGHGGSRLDVAVRTGTACDTMPYRDVVPDLPPDPALDFTERYPYGR